MTKIWWSLDHERTWLASRLAEKTTNEDKERLLRSYLSALQVRCTSFDGLNDMQREEYSEMETFCLKQLYELESNAN